MRKLFLSLASLVLLSSVVYAVDPEICRSLEFQIAAREASKIEVMNDPRLTDGQKAAAIISLDNQISTLRGQQVALGCIPGGQADPSCADFGKVGIYPNCTDIVTPPDTTCADLGKEGVYPNCGLCSDTNKLGVFPDCRDREVPPDPTCADLNKVGVYPNCTDIVNPPDTTCADLGKEGVYPNCGLCSDTNRLGVYPDCRDRQVPPADTCADLGKEGVYPNCGLCSDTNRLGVYPNCRERETPPVDTTTCEDLGKIGTYPNCRERETPPVDTTTCEDLGKIGTYPNCTDKPGNPGNPGDDDDDDQGNGGNDRVTICHKESGNNPKTMTVNRHALRGHLGHGDHEGACVDSGANGDNEDEVRAECERMKARGASPRQIMDYYKSHSRRGKK